MSDLTSTTSGAAASPSSVVLRGSRCATCGNVAFPVPPACQRCGGEAVEPVHLADRGVVWADTVQRFPPKSPPYVPPAEGFEPFAVGYVELPEGVRVEAILESVEPNGSDDLAGAEVSLVAIDPVPRFATQQWLDTRADVAARGGGVDE